MNLRPGDLISIPVAGKFGLAKVIYCSEYFKDVVLIRLFKTIYSNISIKTFPESTALADLYYTSADPIKRGFWKKVGSQPVSETEVSLSKRIVGGDVWLGDEHLGPASDHDIATLPSMRTYGHRLIEKAISQMESD